MQFSTQGKIKDARLIVEAHSFRGVVRIIVNLKCQ